MYLGKFSPIIRCLKCGQTNLARFLSSVQESCDTIQKYLGLNPGDAAQLVKYQKLGNVDSENLVENINTLTSYGYSKEQIAKHGILLRRIPRKLYDHYMVMKEVGFINMTPLALASFRKLLHKKVRTLKTLEFLPQELNVTDNLLLHLNPKPVDFFFNFTDEDNVALMHMTILKRYLIWRLEATSDEIESFFRVYHCLKHKSFQHLCENIEMALSLGFTPRKLLSFGYILSNIPNYTKQVLRDMPNLAGTDLRVQMRRYPKLVCVPPKHYKKIYKMLKDEEIPDAIIAKAMNIFTLSPKTVKMRLDEVRNIPEMNVMRHNPRLLRLIVHHNRARSRLTFMQHLRMRCHTMPLLENDSEKYFDGHIKDGKDINIINDLITLLTKTLNADPHAILPIFRRHPHHLHVAMKDIEKTLRFLQHRFTNSVIVKSIPIVLYPVPKIQEAINEVEAIQKKIGKSRLSGVKKLNLALYLIEKQHHFSGNGVYTEVEPSLTE